MCTFMTVCIQSLLQQNYQNEHLKYFFISFILFCLKMTLSDEEILTISKKITDIALLGLKLGYESGEVDAFEQQNNVDLSKRKGTYAMLKEWYAKDRSTKAKLVQALRDSGMGKLAERVAKGEFGKDSSQPSQGGAASSMPDQSRADGSIDELTLTNIGGEIPDDKLDELGIVLGFNNTQIKHFKDTNYRTSEVTSAGAVSMLRKWSEKVAPSQERAELRAALKKIQLIRIQDKYLPE